MKIGRISDIIKKDYHCLVDVDFPPKIEYDEVREYLEEMKTKQETK